jgi:hypothetical protein
MGSERKKLKMMSKFWARAVRRLRCGTVFTGVVLWVR